MLWNSNFKKIWLELIKILITKCLVEQKAIFYPELMFYYVNTQLYKLDHFGQTTVPSVLTWSVHVNSHETMKITSMRSFLDKNHLKKFALAHQVCLTLRSRVKL